MQSIRVARIVVAASAATLLAAATAPAASAPGLTTSLKASVTPNHIPKGFTGKHGLPIKLSYTATINHPAGSRFQLTKVVVKLPGGSIARANGNLFPSCSVAKLKAAHGRLSACPPGSKIGSGTATGTAVDIGVTSTGKLTLFNGPGGHSIVFNVNIVTPALINDTFNAPLQRTHGKYGYLLTNNIPADLQTILDGPIIVRSIRVTTFATRVIHGVKRGYIEAFKCPKGGKAPLHSDFTFSGGVTSSADTNITCH